MINGVFFRPSFYEALKRLAAGRPATKGMVTKEELERVMVGEHSHAILQALAGALCGAAMASIANLVTPTSSVP
jgi:hypothetical protein